MPGLYVLEISTRAVSESARCNAHVLILFAESDAARAGVAMTAAVSTAAPAWRATRIDPAVALRNT